MLSGVKFLDDDDKGAPRREDRKRHERHPKRHHKSSRDEYDRKRESSLPKKKHDNGGDVVEPKHPQTKEGEQVGVPRLDEDQNYTSLQREDWMTKPISRKIDAEETAWEDEQPKKHEQVENRHIVPETVAAQGPKTVGDGGASWRMKALKRAQIQASVEGKSLQDVVEQRWGSVSQLAASDIRSIAPAMAHLAASRDRRKGCRGKNEREPKSTPYTGTMRMKKPDGERNLNWRRGDGNRGSETRREDARRNETRREDARRSETRRTDMSKKRQGEYDEVLENAARAMNEFRDDGTFLNELENQGTERNDKGVGQEDFNGMGTTHPHHTVVNEKIWVDSEEKKTNNVSAAAMLKAKLTGKRHPSCGSEKRHSHVEEVALPLVDAQGRAAPGAFGRETAADISGGFKPQKRMERYENGEKTRYFTSDDSVDLDTLVKRVKHGMEDNMDDIIAKNISKQTRYRESDMDPDAEYDYDVGIDLLEQHKASKTSRRKGSAKEELAQKEHSRQIREYKSMTTTLERCILCFSSEARKKHLTISVGPSSYLALPDRGRLVPGHCCIIPMDHISSSRVSDETIWDEMRNYKKCLLQMYASQGMECIFFETATRIEGMGNHTKVECVPLPPDAAAKAPMYFRKAIDDATSDWSQHAAKKFIDTESRNLQRCIPPNFPYIHIEFGLTSGFVHVIDDPKTFDPLLARRVLIGLLRLPEETMHRNVHRESERVQRQWATEFSQQFSPYDWTTQL